MSAAPPTIESIAHTDPATPEALLQDPAAARAVPTIPARVIGADAPEVEFKRSRADSSVLEGRFVVVFVAIGVLLRAWQFFGTSSLFWGELALARNINARGIGQLLTERTAFGQGSALGYLAVEKAIVSAFGSSELTHRFFPFVASLLSVWLFVKITELYLSGTPRVFAVASFALGFPFVMVIAPFKPLCTVETAATLALFLLAYQLLISPPTRARLLGSAVGGFSLMWFSEPAAVQAFGLIAALSLILAHQRQWRKLARLSPVFLVWAATAVATPLLMLGITDAATREVLRSLYVGGSMPADIRFWIPAKWLWARLNDALGPDLLHYQLRPAYAGLIALGLLPLLRMQGTKAVLLLAPIASALVASAIGFYIFQGFYLAFLLPYLFILAALGMNVVREQLARVSAPVGAAWVLACAAIPVGAIAKYLPPYRVEETRPILEYVDEQWKAGDALYGFFGARHAMTYYAPKLGLDTTAMVVGGCHHAQPRAYLAELDQFRGRSRVWVVFAHDLGRYQARGEMLNYLNQIGIARDSLVLNTKPIPRFVVGAQAYLFDLSDSTRLASTTAATVALLRPTTGNVSECGGGMESAEKP